MTTSLFQHAQNRSVRPRRPIADTPRVSATTGQVKTSYLSFTVPATPGRTVTTAELVLYRTGHHLG